MKILSTYFVAILFVLGLLIVKESIADTGTTSGVLSAVYDFATGELTVSGMYANAPASKKKIPGFAVFINGATPDTDMSDPRVLDGAAHLLPKGVSSGLFSDIHVLSDKPESVCVVLYDVHLRKKNSPKRSGGHSAVAAGDRRNTDNSYDSNNNNDDDDDNERDDDNDVEGSYLPSACTMDISSPDGGNGGEV